MTITAQWQSHIEKWETNELKPVIRTLPTQMEVKLTPNTCEKAWGY
jgi:hypothetical protein